MAADCQLEQRAYSGGLGYVSSSSMYRPTSKILSQNSAAHAYFCFTKSSRENMCSHSHGWSIIHVSSCHHRASSDPKLLASGRHYFSWQRSGVSGPHTEARSRSACRRDACLKTVHRNIRTCLSARRESSPQLSSLLSLVQSPLTSTVLALLQPGMCVTSWRTGATHHLAAAKRSSVH